MPATRFLLYDAVGNLLDDSLPVWSATRKQSLQGADWSDTLNLDVDKPVEKGRYVVFRTEDGEWCEYRVTSPDDIREDGLPSSNVQCVNSVQELAATRPVQWMRETDVAARTVADMCTQGTRWSVGTVDDVMLEEFEMSGTNGWDGLKKLAASAGLEIITQVLPDSSGSRIGSRTVGLVKRRGSVSGKRFEYGADLEKVRRTYDADEVYSRVIPLGKDTDSGRPLTIASVNDGLDYLDSIDPTLLERWGIPDGSGELAPPTLVVVHSDIDDPGLLRTTGYTDLDAHSMPLVTYEATVAGYAMAGFDASGLKLGDTVQIVDRSFAPPLRLEGRVSGLEEDPLAGVDSTVVTLGNVIESLSQRQAVNDRTTSTVNVGKPVWDAASGLASSAHDTAQSAMSDVNQVGQTVLTVQQVAEAAGQQANDARSAVALIGSPIPVTFPAASFASNVCDVPVAGLGEANLISPYDPLTERADWDACRPVFASHSMLDAVPAGSIRATCAATPAKDLRAMVTVLRAPGGVDRLIQTYWAGSGGEAPSVKPVTKLTPSVTSLTLTLAPATRDTGAKTFDVTVEPADATDRSLTVSSGDTAVATATVDGATVTVAPVAVGSTTVTVASRAWPSATAVVQVTVVAQSVPVTAVTADKTLLSGTVGETGTVSFTIEPADATDRSLTVVSSNTDVATVTGSNPYTVSYVGAGSAVITAASNSDPSVKAETQVAVAPVVVPVTGVSASPTSLSGETGGSGTITFAVEPSDATDQTLDVSSSDEKVATVTGGNPCTVDYVSAGEAVITGASRSDPSKTASVPVTVTDPVIPVTGVTVSPGSATLDVGQSITLTAKVKPDDASDKSVAWASSDRSVATVDQSGRVTASSAGSATITATSGMDSSKQGSASLTVREAYSLRVDVNGTRVSNGGRVTVGDDGAVSIGFTITDSAGGYVSDSMDSAPSVSGGYPDTISVAGVFWYQMDPGSATIALSNLTYDGRDFGTFRVTITVPEPSYELRLVSDSDGEITSGSSVYPSDGSYSFSYAVYKGGSFVSSSLDSPPSVSPSTGVETASFRYFYGQVSSTTTYTLSNLTYDGHDLGTFRVTVRYTAPVVTWRAYIQGEDSATGGASYGGTVYVKANSSKVNWKWCVIKETSGSDNEYYERVTLDSVPTVSGSASYGHASKTGLAFKPYGSSSDNGTLTVRGLYYQGHSLPSLTFNVYYR